MLKDGGDRRGHPPLRLLSQSDSSSKIAELDCEAGKKMVVMCHYDQMKYMWKREREE